LYNASAVAVFSNPKKIPKCLAQNAQILANYTEQSQTFAACSTLNNIVDGELSGILGLGFQTIASSGATPIVQALAQDGKLPEEVFGFAFQ